MLDQAASQSDAREEGHEEQSADWTSCGTCVAADCLSSLTSHKETPTCYHYSPANHHSTLSGSLNMSKLLALATLLVAALAHEGHDHDQTPISGPHPGLWFNGMPGDGDTQVKDVHQNLFPS